MELYLGGRDWVERLRYEQRNKVESPSHTRTPTVSQTEPLDIHFPFPSLFLFSLDSHTHTLPLYTNTVSAIGPMDAGRMPGSMAESSCGGRKQSE